MPGASPAATPTTAPLRNPPQGRRPPSPSTTGRGEWSAGVGVSGAAPGSSLARRMGVGSGSGMGRGMARAPEVGGTGVRSGQGAGVGAGAGAEAAAAAARRRRRATTFGRETPEPEPSAHDTAGCPRTTEVDAPDVGSTGTEARVGELTEGVSRPRPILRLSIRAAGLAARRSGTVVGRVSSEGDGPGGLSSRGSTGVASAASAVSALAVSASASVWRTPAAEPSASDGTDSPEPNPEAASENRPTVVGRRTAASKGEKTLAAEPSACNDTGVPWLGVEAASPNRPPIARAGTASAGEQPPPPEPSVCRTACRLEPSPGTASEARACEPASVASCPRSVPQLSARAVWAGSVWLVDVRPAENVAAAEADAVEPVPPPARPMMAA